MPLKNLLIGKRSDTNAKTVPANTKAIPTNTKAIPTNAKASDYSDVGAKVESWSNLNVAKKRESFAFNNKNTNFSKRSDWTRGSRQSSVDSTMTHYPFVKSSRERARESFEIASRFKSKTWLQQVRIGSQIALNDFRKSLQSMSIDES